MLRALTCPSSGGKIVFTQHLVSSLSVNGCTVRRLRADCSAVCSQPVYCTNFSRIKGWTGMAQYVRHIWAYISSRRNSFHLTADQLQRETLSKIGFHPLTALFPSSSRYLKSYCIYKITKRISDFK